MPGYILHLTSARMLLDLFSADDSLCSDCGMQNDFYVGNLLPDAGSSKPASHFYDPEYLDRMIVWPRPGEFRRKYREQLEDPLYLGYYYHLYIDKAYICAPPIQMILILAIKVCIAT